MQIKNAIAFGLLLVFLAPGELVAQAIGEYGRIIGNAPQRQGSASSGAARASQNSKGKAVVQGIGDTAGRPIPPALIVVSRQIGLYPRQDDTADKITELSEGETLTPMLQSKGGNDWYMVKTQQGLIGWVKAGEVREDAGKKQ